MYLVDTSVWIDFLRGRNAAHVTALRALLEQDEVVGIAPMILQEILQGADSEARFERWRTYFADLFCYIPADVEACTSKRPAVPALSPYRKNAAQQQ
ncbi:MAG: PIN domain-containing protein [Burkholderiales bacterium]